jgi:hypothetical protein
MALRCAILACPRIPVEVDSDRATRNMDRFAIRRDGQKVVVSLVKLYRSDQQKAEWEGAVIAL